MNFIKFGTETTPRTFKLPPLFSIGDEPATSPAPAAPVASPERKTDPKFFASLDAEAAQLNIVNVGIARRYLANADAFLDRARARAEDVQWLGGPRQAARELVAATTKYVDSLKTQLAPYPDNAPLAQITVSTIPGKKGTLAARHVVLALRQAAKTFKTVDAVAADEFKFWPAYLAALKEVIVWSANAAKETVKFVAEATATAVKPLAEAASPLLWPLAIGAVGVGGIILLTKSGSSAPSTP